METIGSFEAKTHWSRLLDKVAHGSEIIITKRGKPIARLIPELNVQSEDVEAAVAMLKKLRKKSTLGRESWKTLRDIGRS